jgi:hypothetical protein
MSTNRPNPINLPSGFGETDLLSMPGIPTIQEQR